MVVTATSANLSRDVTTSCAFEPANGSALSTTGSITVTAGFGGMSDTTTVTSYAIESIAITTLPQKIYYGVDEALDLTGIVVTASAGTITKDVTNECTFSPVNGTIFTEEGTETITATYLSFTATMTVEVIENAELEYTTWAKIKTIGTEGTGSQYWSVGDSKTITLNGTVGTIALSNFQCKVFIIDFNYRGVNGIYFQGFKTTDATPIDIAIVDSYYDNDKSDGTKIFNINHWGTAAYGGWKGCDLRYDILGSTDVAPSGYGAQAVSGRVGYDATSNAISSPVANTLMSALPSDLRAVLAPWTVYTDNVDSGQDVEANVTASVDYLPLLAEYEVFGSITQANNYENSNNKQKQMAYYVSGNSPKKYKHSVSSYAVSWWERSPCATQKVGKSFCRVNMYGDSSRNNTYYSYGLAPAFRVA